MVMQTVLCVAVWSVAASAVAETIDFSADAVGQPPAGWHCGMTGRGAPRWTVETDPGAAAGKVLRQSRVGDLSLVRQEGCESGRRLGRDEVQAAVRQGGPGRRRGLALEGRRSVGVWTKADSVTAFAEFAYQAARP